MRAGIFVPTALLILISMITSAKATNKLTVCPDKPNCVSSLAAEAVGRQVKPFKVYGSWQNARQGLREIVLAMPRARLLTEESGRLHFIFTSRLFGFVDDVVFEYDESANLINVQSAARTGYYDFGVNRRRIDEIRRLYELAHEKRE